MLDFMMGICFTLAVEFLGIVLIALYYGGNDK